MTTTFTDTPTTVMVAGQPVTGRLWVLEPHMPTETGSDATTYIARNTGKTRTAHAFLGVPYAHQPVGARRFMPAVKKNPTAPIDASKYGPVPHQGYFGERVDHGKGRSDKGRLRGLTAWAANRTREREDCLYMNIWTPDPTATGLPVWVRFHGGGAFYLSANDDRGAGDRLCVKGMVVINVGYRVGNLGHFWLPDMEGKAGIAGTVNHSLTDCLAALQFIAEHVWKWGGDKTNVTIFGESNGAQLVECMAANPDFHGLFRHWWPSSASIGVIPRVTNTARQTTPSYQDWCGERLDRIQFFASRGLVDQMDPSRSLADAIAEVGISQAMRQHLYVQQFLALDEGRYGVATEAAGPFDGYTPTRNIGVCQDFKTVFHANARASAAAGVYAAKNAMIGYAENEYSVINPITSAAFFQRQLFYLTTGMTSREWAASAIFSTEYNGNPASPSWGTVDTDLEGLPWTTLEPSRMMFGHVYGTTARWMARGVQAAGATSYWYQFNYKGINNPAPIYSGHTDDVHYILGNTPWDYPPPESGPGEAMTTRDLRMTDMMMQAAANFAATGNPNTPYASEWDFDLFADASTETFTAFNPADRNCNVIGNPFRSATDSPATITSINNFWAHAFNTYDTRAGLP